LSVPLETQSWRSAAGQSDTQPDRPGAAGSARSPLACHEGAWRKPEERKFRSFVSSVLSWPIRRYKQKIGDSLQPTQLHQHLGDAERGEVGDRDDGKVAPHRPRADQLFLSKGRPEQSAF